MPKADTQFSQPGDLLDPDELLHLALRASEKEQSESALTLLKRALQQAPDDAKLHYMLGAEHAQLGMYDRAVAEMARAVNLDPSLHTAHFQLGLLHMTSGRMGDAEQAWQPLERLPEEHALRLFKHAFQHLVRDEFDAFTDLATRGIAANDFNTPLNRDMERLMAQVRTRRTGLPPATMAVSEASTATGPAGHHVLLNGYRKD